MHYVRSRFVSGHLAIVKVTHCLKGSLILVWCRVAYLTNLLLRCAACMSFGFLVHSVGKQMSFSLINTTTGSCVLQIPVSDSHSATSAHRTHFNGSCNIHFNIILQSFHKRFHVSFVDTFCFFIAIYEGWNFNSGNYLFTIDTK